MRQGQILWNAPLLVLVALLKNPFYPPQHHRNCSSFYHCDKKKDLAYFSSLWIFLMSSACLPVYSPIPCSRLMFQWWKTVTSATFNLSRPLPLFLEHWNTATPPNFFKLFVTSVCFIATYKRIKLNWQKNQTSSVASHLPWCYLGAFASKSVNSQWLKKIHFHHIFFFSWSMSSSVFAFHHLPAADLMSGFLLESTLWTGFDSCSSLLAPGGIFKSIFLS